MKMQNIVNSLNKLLPVGKKVKKYLPFFIGFKLLTFTGFLTYLMNQKLNQNWKTNQQLK